MNMTNSLGRRKQEMQVTINKQAAGSIAKITELFENQSARIDDLKSRITALEAERKDGDE